MEERIGTERSAGTYAFKSLLDNGATLVFRSDWPGTNAAEYCSHPKYLLNAAVNRTTINSARATFDGDIKGSILKDKLADVVILDRNIFERPPGELLSLQVDLTMVNGRVVFERDTGSKQFQGMFFMKLFILILV